MNNKQSGMSSIALLLIMVAGAIILLVAFRIGPLYIDNYFVKVSVESLEDENLRSMSDGQIRNALERYFTVNGVRDISSRSAEIERDAKDVTVKLDYEKRANVVGNLDAVVRFENHYSTKPY